MTKKIIQKLKIYLRGAIFIIIPNLPSTSPSPVPAPTTVTPPNIANIHFPLTLSSINNAQDLIAAIINWLMGIAGVLAVIALIYSGIMYITAGANTDQADKAKKNITWAIIGLIIILLSIVIVNTVNNIIKTNPS